QHGTKLAKSAAPPVTLAANAAMAPPAAGGGPPTLTVLPTPPVAPPVVEQPPVDLERLNDFAGGNPDNFNELVCLYLKQTTEQIEQIRRALAERNAEQVSQVAHSCAGASATCGMVALVPLLRQVEHFSQEG